MFTRSPRQWMVLAAAPAALALVVAACSGGSSPTATGAAAVPGGGGGGAGAAIAGAGRLDAVPQTGSNQQTGIWVDGAGAVTVVPDVGVLSFAVETRAETVAPARASAAAAMDAVLKSLRKNGVQDRDIQTTSFQIQPITVFPQPRPGGGPADNEPRIVGYRVSNAATARVRDLNAIGKVIDDAVAAGGDAIRVNSIGFTVDDPKPLLRRARELALQDAIAKAQQMATVAGVTLGKPTFISEQGSTPIVERFALGAAKADATAPTPINPGETQITVRVQMVFAIQ